MIAAFMHLLLQCGSLTVASNYATSVECLSVNFPNAPSRSVRSTSMHNYPWFQPLKLSYSLIHHVSQAVSGFSRKGCCPVVLRIFFFSEG